MSVKQDSTVVKTSLSQVQKYHTVCYACRVDLYIKPTNHKYFLDDLQMMCSLSIAARAQVAIHASYIQVKWLVDFSVQSSVVFTMKTGMYFCSVN